MARPTFPTQGVPGRGLMTVARRHALITHTPCAQLDGMRRQKATLGVLLTNFLSGFRVSPVATRSVAAQTPGRVYGGEPPKPVLEMRPIQALWQHGERQRKHFAFCRHHEAQTSPDILFFLNVLMNPSHHIDETRLSCCPTIESCDQFKKVEREMCSEGK